MGLNAKKAPRTGGDKKKFAEQEVLEAGTYPARRS